MWWWCISIKLNVNQKAWIAGILMMTFSIYSATGFADIFETLVMPGKVVEAHKKYEAECQRCHKKLGSKSETKLCLECHERVASDVRHKKGFHGKAPGIRTGECRVCHTEHVGRKGDIVKFYSHTFNHTNTDFPLEGIHAQTKCKSCHKVKLKYRDASTQCIQCHRKEDPHSANLKKVDKKLQPCDVCHTARRWQEICFNHKKTDFKLTGKHRNISCQSCHKNDNYKDTVKTCYGCHKINDVHKGSQGKKCQNCHSTRGWKKISFDHNRKTKFPLRGKHKPLDCHSCHKGDPKKVKLKKTCISCHREDDVHTTRFGNKCEKCHTEKEWDKNTFSHDKDTKFVLRGKHKKQECASCHIGKIYKDKLKTACYSCHKLDDVHQKKQGRKCGQCHNESGWAEKVVFEHDATPFPLMGLHSITPCEECHVNAKYQSAKKECLACHETKDVHKGTLGKKCQSCHTPNAWRIWVFEHDTQTDFKLTGKHLDLNCDSCHYKSLENMKSTVNECVSCHSGDDIHHGQFGANCQRCHSTKRFQDIKDFH